MRFDSDEVGPGRPPKHSRFKKGESGNPKGRPKGSFNLRTIFERALREKVRIREKGRYKDAKKWEVAMRQLANRAAGGDLPAIRLILIYGPALLDSPSAEDLRELAEFKEMNRRLESMSNEELEARQRELIETREALERHEAKEEKIRARKRKE